MPKRLAAALLVATLSGCHPAADPSAVDSAPIPDIVAALQPVITDPAADWATVADMPPGGSNHYAPVDLLQVWMGARGGRLYIRVKNAGVMPSPPVVVDGNTIDRLSYSFLLDTDNNQATGNFGGETFLQLAVHWSSGQLRITPWFQAKYLAGGGDTATFAATGDGLLHTAHGGPGSAEFVVSYSLADLLDTVPVGQQIHVTAWAEAQSTTYHHFAYDETSPASVALTIDGI
jgi:hypothetical protein